MIFESLRYELVSVAVNRTPGAAVLAHAEEDGRRYASHRVSALGPGRPERSQLLLGPAATCEAIDAALLTVVRRRPRFLEFAFDGHGNAEGLSAADDLYPFTLLENRLAAAGAQGTLVTLNSCGSGGFAKTADVRLGGLGDIAWEEGLLSSVPGVRGLLASTADGTTKEVRGMGSVFRRALMAAMFDRGPGDLVFAGVEFASELLVLQRAMPLMAAFGVYPLAFGPNDGWSDFPMAVANRQIVGEAAIAIGPALGYGANARLAIRGRRYLQTTIIVSAMDALGRPLPARRRDIVPTSDDTVVSDVFESDLGASAACRYQLSSYGACQVAWRASVLDHNGMMIATAHRVLAHPIGSCSLYGR